MRRNLRVALWAAAMLTSVVVAGVVIAGTQASSPVCGNRIIVRPRPATTEIR
jgi:hypothetical protein